MQRYTGDKPFRDAVLEGIRAGEVVLPTDQGTLKFRARPPVGNLVHGRTDDGKMITIDLDDPDTITVV